jgi:hypothetical protein
VHLPILPRTACISFFRNVRTFELRGTRGQLAAPTSEHSVGFANRKVQRDCGQARKVSSGSLTSSNEVQKAKLLWAILSISPFHNDPIPGTYSSRVFQQQHPQDHRSSRLPWHLLLCFQGGWNYQCSALGTANQYRDSDRSDQLQVLRPEPYPIRRRRESGVTSTTFYDVNMDFS